MKKLRQEPRNKFDAETTPASKKREEKKKENLGISLTGTASKQTPWNSQTDWSNAPRRRPKS
jgi:hypothetical protein